MTRGDKTSGRRTHHPTKGGIWAEAAPEVHHRCTSNKGKQEGVQVETKGDKTLGKRAHHPTKGGKKGYNQRQNLREGGHTIQHRKTRGTMGDKGRQDRPSNKGKQEGVQWETRGARPSGRRTHHPTQENKKRNNGRQRETGHTIQQRETRRGTGDKTPGKVDTPSNKGKQAGRRWETRPREGGHTIQERETTRGTMGGKRRQ